jgi:hypothetical protein
MGPNVNLGGGVVVGFGLGNPYQVLTIDRNKCVELIDYNVF